LLRSLSLLYSLSLFFASFHIALPHPNKQKMPRPKKKKATLLDGDGDVAPSEGGLSIRVNENYAKKFEVRSGVDGRAHVARVPRLQTHTHIAHTAPPRNTRKKTQHNKRREELQRLQEKHPHMAARLERGLVSLLAVLGGGEDGVRAAPAAAGGVTSRADYRHCSQRALIAHTPPTKRSTARKASRALTTTTTTTMRRTPPPPPT
jgi:hypothetical protein